ncbi:TPA: hypothetical protein ACX6NP_000762 [Photobacterium damselae]|uniref:hypothetical protein n=1 Tax=Photobacterium damselae TaxID=38293 RepID=UPI001F41B46B|nr:hypothetical protein [Photobacterium damselae]UKA08988.1 hypothetical protein IHC91_08055 [Photobacterium damselae subsp. damselae]
MRLINDAVLLVNIKNKTSIQLTAWVVKRKSDMEAVLLNPRDPRFGHYEERDISQLSELIKDGYMVTFDDFVITDIEFL